jgi:hypothetical protein
MSLGSGPPERPEDESIGGDLVARPIWDGRHRNAEALDISVDCGRLPTQHLDPSRHGRLQVGRAVGEAARRRAQLVVRHQRIIVLRGDEARAGAGNWVRLFGLRAGRIVGWSSHASTGCFGTFSGWSCCVAGRRPRTMSRFLSCATSWQCCGGRSTGRVAGRSIGCSSRRWSGCFLETGGAACFVRAETIRRWHRALLARRWTYPSRRPGRFGVSVESSCHSSTSRADRQSNLDASCLRRRRVRRPWRRPRAGHASSL